jgi:hypothetical protein
VSNNYKTFMEGFTNVARRPFNDATQIVNSAGFQDGEIVDAVFLDGGQFDMGIVLLSDPRTDAEILESFGTDNFKPGDTFIICRPESHRCYKRMKNRWSPGRNLERG